MKAFISYSHQDRAQAIRVKAMLSEFEIDAFLAHDDIEVSNEWRDRIMTELKQCTIFVALLSESFRTSDWAPQETGIAAARPDVLIIPLSLDGTTAFGFIAHLQSRRFPGATSPLSLVLGPICSRFPDETIPRIISALADSWAWRRSEALMEILQPHFSDLTTEQVHQVTQAAVANFEIWLAADCLRTYLPDFMAKNDRRINRDLLEVLRYQIENQIKYPGTDPARVEQAKVS